MRHSNRRVEQGLRTRDYQGSSPSNTTASAKPGFAHHEYSDEDQDYVDRSPVDNQILPYLDAIKLNWKWSSDADVAGPGFGDMSSRSVVVKERSVFVGRIPDGIEDIGEVLQSLMETFLERFDFAPFELGQVQVVKLLKDFAFLELASDKVAQVVLAANQLDVFEWGFNGCHFNIEGCNGTHTSVKPLYEYIPLRPARVIFVGNIPKTCWQKEYLEEAFTKILWGSDGQTDLKPVVAVYLLPESCDAYVELASEFVADALIYKCTKNDQLLKEIGEEVFICRDVNSPPMMSRHKVDVCPQRSLFIGISARDEYFKLDCIRRVFEDILPLVSRKINCHAYLEYISIQPGKDYAFFQFNSETIADALMDEYVENTQLFVCKNVNVTYIILRLPEYVRPGAKYRHSSNQRRLPGRRPDPVHKKGPINANADRRKVHGNNQFLPRKSMTEQPGSLMPPPRRFGDEPTKKADCVMSIGASLPPIAIWNGPGASSADPDSLIVIEGVPKGFNYKLLRGALNELFERALAQTGLLDVGMLVLGYLDRDEDFDLVGCLPSAEFVHALLSSRKAYVVCGHEIRLLPKDASHNSNGRLKVVGATSWGQEEFSGSEDEEAAFARGSFQNGDQGEWSGPGYPRSDRKRNFPEDANGYNNTMGSRGPNFRRKFPPPSGADDWCHGQGVPPMQREEFGGGQQGERDWNGYNGPRAANEGYHWQESNPRHNGGPRAYRGPGYPSVENRNFMHGKDAGRNMRRGFRRFN